MRRERDLIRRSRVERAREAAGSIVEDFEVGVWYLLPGGEEEKRRDVGGHDGIKRGVSDGRPKRWKRSDGGKLLKGLPDARVFGSAV